MLIMIIHSSGSPIPYNVISDLAASREVEGTHIPLPARSKRERAEMIQDFILKAQENREQAWLLVVNEELGNDLKLDWNSGIDTVLYCYQYNNGHPAVSIRKNGIGDEGVSYEEFLQDLKNFTLVPQQELETEKPKFFVRTQGAS